MWFNFILFCNIGNILSQFEVFFVKIIIREKQCGFEFYDSAFISRMIFDKLESFSWFNGIHTIKSFEYASSFIFNIIVRKFNTCHKMLQCWIINVIFSCVTKNRFIGKSEWNMLFLYQFRPYRWLMWDNTNMCYKFISKFHLFKQLDKWSSFW